MKNFDPESVKGRSLKRLSKKPAYTNIEKDGAIEQYTEEQAEMIAEAARYGENMQREMKWDTARGFSSVKHMARLVGKKLDRKRSAVGTLICTHTTFDKNHTVLGQDRLSNLGKDVLNVNEESDYDENIQVSDGRTGTPSKALVPWWDPDYSYTLPIGAHGRNSNGFSYVVAQTKSIQYWNKSWSTIKKYADQLSDFYAKGGWDGYKYLTVPVVQGEIRTAYLGESDNTASQVFILDTLDIEAADRYYTRQFLYIEVATSEGIQRWEEVQNLTTCNSTAKKFEIQILDDLSGTAIIFGDGINGAVPENGAGITLHYLKTDGAEGNTPNKFSFNDSIEGAEIPPKLLVSIGFQNPWPILGGTDLEGLKEFKKNAESAYAKNYKTIHTLTEFREQLNTISPIYLLKYKVKTGFEKQVVNSLEIYTNKVQVTGITTTLNKLSTTEQVLFNSIINRNMNDGVIFDMSVVYKDPSIVKINSNIEIEPREKINDVELVETQLTDYLYNTYGPYVNESLDKYQQITLIKGLLGYYDNIASENSLDMIELDQQRVEYEMDGTVKITWDLPAAVMDNLGANKTLILDEKDGYVYPFVIQINLKGIYLTMLVYKDGDKCTLKVLNKTKYTFSSAELRDQASLVDNVDTDWLSTPAGSKASATASFKVLTASSENLTVELKLPKAIIANRLEIVEAVEEYDEQDTEMESTLKRELDKSIQDGVTNFAFSFIPADKTIKFSDWNTILYYNNIGVYVKQ